MKENRNLFNRISLLYSEQRNNRSLKIDTLKVDQILRLINLEDYLVAEAVKKELHNIRKAIKIVVDALSHSGRLIYVGAGTSGRLGILDAAECPPTFGTHPRQILGIIAGGKNAVFRSKEGAEDKTKAAVHDMRAISVNRRDVVCGLAASATTPYVLTALTEAKRCGAKLVLITTNPRSMIKNHRNRTLGKQIDVSICPVVGPEVIMGSTRMKSGTAQKMILNMITTTSMILMGKVYENMMVDLKMNSRKLEERAKRVLMIATGVDYPTAVSVLSRANGHVKTAIVMIKRNVDARDARNMLKKAKGFVRRALEAR